MSMRFLLVALLLGSSLMLEAQSSAPSDPQAPANPPARDSSKASPSQQMPPPNVAPPRSDRVNVGQLGDNIGESSSKDTQVDLSPPANDDKSHPQSEGMVKDAEVLSGTNISEAHLWNPHKAAKDIEVGDFYFKRKNYRAAEDRYREALLYKENDATATFRLAESLEKLEQPDEARIEYENYLKILPGGPQAAAAKKALERLKASTANGEPAH